MIWLISIGSFIAFFLLRGLFYYLKLKAIDKYKKQYFKYLQKEENIFLRSKPSIKYLLVFRDQDMLRRLKEINSLPQKDKECILYNLDAVLRDVKTRLAYS